MAESGLLITPALLRVKRRAVALCLAGIRAVERRVSAYGLWATPPAGGQWTVSSGSSRRPSPPAKGPKGRPARCRLASRPGTTFHVGRSASGVSHRAWDGICPQRPCCPSRHPSLHTPSQCPQQGQTWDYRARGFDQSLSAQERLVLPTPCRCLSAPHGECTCGSPGPPESDPQPLRESNGGRCFRPPWTTLTPRPCVLVSIKPRASLKVFLRTKTGTFS